MTSSGKGLPLAAIRVVDLSRVFAMPYAGAYLADLGAEVIKIDTLSPQFMDTTRTITGPFPDNDPGELYWERGGTFHTLNRGKRSLTLDLRSDEARSILRDLVSVSDVLLENFTPRVMARFELDYHTLKSVRPDLVMVSNTGYGHSGPWTNFGAMASALEPTHGTGAFMGYREPGRNEETGPQSIPNKIGNSFTDFLATWTALVATMASLIHRASTGQGMWIDLAMYQVGVSFIGEGVLDYAYNGRRTRRIGNRHESMCPHGCYACLGDDRWVTLAVRDDRDWSAFCEVLEQPTLAADPRFSNSLARQQHQDQLDSIITQWTSTRSPYEVMELLQAKGVPAGPVLDARQMLADPQFRSRGFFESVQHPPETGLGQREYIGRGWKLSGADVTTAGPGPLLGEANEYTLGDLLGLDAHELDRLKNHGVGGRIPNGGLPPSTVSIDRQAELGWVAARDIDYVRFLNGAMADSSTPSDEGS